MNWEIETQTREKFIIKRDKGHRPIHNKMDIKNETDDL